ncbi:hypothetical protein [Acidiferrobacter sp. SPIII_3]|jgi:hypothetical protein|uniref:hypothetical protein n=1 Tax=Acidiferrobacter sp. SPIII_3 TaxID=1281578 RepID=UPI0011AB672D|nr:hypothetical protein [Acidiferrobacter sp. SPIII_3]
MMIRTGLTVLALTAALPAFAASTTFTGKVEVALRHQGFTANEAARIAHEAARHYRGPAAAKFAQGLQHLPTLPKSDYNGATLKSQAQTAYARVLTQAFTKAEGARDVAATCHAFTKAVKMGTEPLATARLVVEGLKDGLRGRALAKLTHQYTVRIHKGVPEKVAYRESLTANVSHSSSFRSSNAGDRFAHPSSPVGQPTGMNPTPGAMGANVNGMGNAPAGSMTGAMGAGAGAGAGAMSGPGGMGAGAGAGGGSMGRP